MMMMTWLDSAWKRAHTRLAKRIAATPAMTTTIATPDGGVMHVRTRRTRTNRLVVEMTHPMLHPLVARTRVHPAVWTRPLRLRDSLFRLACYAALWPTDEAITRWPALPKMGYIASPLDDDEDTLPLPTDPPAPVVYQPGSFIAWVQLPCLAIHGRDMVAIHLPDGMAVTVWNERSLRWDEATDAAIPGYRRQVAIHADLVAARRWIACLAMQPPDPASGPVTLAGLSFTTPAGERWHVTDTTIVERSEEHRYKTFAQKNDRPRSSGDVTDAVAVETQ